MSDYAPADPTETHRKVAMQNGESTVSTAMSWLNTRVLARLDVEQLLYVTFIAIAIISRLWDLGARVMSHDESLHTYFSYNLATGKGFAHTPLMHGPFLFHITALSYFLFGANDFTSRIPPALFGILLVALPIFFRRWLGRVGALIASFALLISPSILYHARYIRQEEFVLVWTLLTALCVFRYLETRKPAWLIGLAVVLALHATDKSTSFLSVALFVAFLAPLALLQLYVSRRKVNDVSMAVLLAAVIGILMLCISVIMEVGSRFLTERLTLTSVIAQLNPLTLTFDTNTLIYAAAIVLLAVLSGLIVWFLLRGLFSEWYRHATQAAPALNLVIVMVITTMFMASPAMLLLLNPIWKFAYGTELISVKLLGEMSNLASNPSLIATMFALAAALISVSIAIAVALDWRRWLPVVGVYVAITSTFFTTVFSNAGGFGTGFVGQLGYWMAQQEVKRGGQPSYYYFLIVPLYEYMLMIGSLCAIVYIAYRIGMLLMVRVDPAPIEQDNSHVTAADDANTLEADVQVVRPVSIFDHPLGQALVRHDKLFPIFLLWWTLATWIIYTIAGEKMPWLTVHIALPMALLTAWFFNAVLTPSANHRGLGNYIKRQTTLLIGGLAIFIVLMTVRALSLIGGLNLQPSDTVSFIRWAGGFLLACLLIAAALYAINRIAAPLAGRAIFLAAFAFLSVLTIRTAFTVTYINYDYTKEFLFYAHGAPGVKLALSQLEELSRRLTGDMTINVGYDADVSWPMTWYMRDYPNARYYGEALPEDFESLDVIMLGDVNPKRGENEAKLLDNYTRFNYMLVWWPMQDYFDLTLERIRFSLVDPEARAALWDIAFNRDFTRYARVFNKTSLTSATWSPGHRFALYVRNDAAQKIWSYRAGTPSQTDKDATTASRLNSPTGIVFTPNGERYVLDHKGNRVFRYDAAGEVTASFGGFGAASGKFNDPWGIAIGVDGSIYVADTFNHRIQKLDSSGNYQVSWGTPGVSAAPGVGRSTIFFGPRAIAVHPDGRLFVTDTGNKRVQVFDQQGNFVDQFGNAGTGNGEFNEPVGIALDSAGNIYVADTWNQRIQVFNSSYQFIRSWGVTAWQEMDTSSLQAVDHKPYLTVYKDILIVSSPGTHEILAYTLEGTQITLPDTTLSNETVPVGLAIYDDTLYVTDTAGAAVLQFTLPDR